MLKIMIVDDEMLSRVALRSMVEGSYQVVAEAADGAEALELAQIHMPDIILVDVIMPGVDGLSFISQVSEKLPLTRYIIISNVEQVEYLKKAIKMKVHDYLIKGTLTKEKLLDTLAELSKRVLRERQNLHPVTETQSPSSSNAVLAELVDKVIRGKICEESELSQVFRLYGMDLEARPYYCLLLRSKDPNLRNVIDRSVILNQGILADCGDGVVLKRAYNELLCIYIPPTQDSGEKDTKDLAYRLVMSNKDIFGVRVVAGISQPAIGYGSLQTAFLQAERAGKESFYDQGEANSIYLYTGLRKEAEDAALKLKQQVKEALQDRSVNTLLKTPALLEELRSAAEASRAIPRETLVGLYLDVIYFAANFAREAGAADFDDLGEAMVALTNADKLNALHTGSLSVVSLALQHYAQASGGSSYVKRIRQYVADNISGELRVEEIAAHVHVSANYLSQMFKNETGMTLRDYIAAERIRRAKDYLLLGKSLRETAQLTGFSTDSYFVQKFKAAVNMTPKQFQKQKKIR